MIPPLSDASNHKGAALSRGAGAIAAAVALIAAVPAQDAAPPYPPRTVLILVAPWCAPCHGEIARVAELAAAARPFEARVLSVEDNARARAMVRGVDPAHRWEPEPMALRRARRDLTARTAGLPYSVAIGGDGRPCAAAGGGLDPNGIRSLVRRCLPSSP